MLAKPQFHLAKSTNSKDFLLFLSQISSKRTDPYSGKLLQICADRHPSHFCELNGVRKTLKQQYSLQILPRASSWHNSCEWIFPHVKAAVRSHFIHKDKETVSMTEFAADVKKVCERLQGTLRYSRIFYANVHELRKAIQDGP